MNKKIIVYESEKRHRIMSDQKIKYLYSSKTRTIHDKHCVCAKSIPDEDLLWAEDYIDGFGFCYKCSMQAYIIAGAKDPKEMERYCSFFEKVQLPARKIRTLYIRDKMKTRIMMDVLTVWYKEDTWLIKSLSEKGHVQLYHNNYVVLENGTRRFTKGFHLQNPTCIDTNISYALERHYQKSCDPKSIYLPILNS